MNKPIRVHTTTICELCGAENDRDGAEGMCPPAGWAEAVLTIRHDGNGWENHTTYCVVVCPDCIGKVKDVLEIE